MDYDSVKVRITPMTMSWRVRPNALPSTPWTSKTQTFNTFEKMEGMTHRLPLNTAADDGGPWKLLRTRDIPTFAVWDKGESFQTFQGQFTVGGITGSYGDGVPFMANPPVAPTDSEVNASGTTAISRVAPTNPAYAGSTFLGETITGGLPMVTGAALVKERARRVRSAGGEYLNVEFGWLPLLRDVQAFARTVQDSHRIISEYRKGSDTKIRRGYHFPTEETTLWAPRNFFPSPTDFPFFGSGDYLQSKSYRAWFSGAFRYHIPVPVTTMDKFQDWMSMTDHLLGVKVTPETVWNIAPWSWAADWFANTGDIMTNISNLGKDGLVMQYGYSMMERVLRSESKARFDGILTKRTQETVHKRRMPATPYGFGVNLSTLSPKQVAIIAALGLSRS